MQKIALKLMVASMIFWLAATFAALPSCNGANPPTVHSITPSVGPAFGGTRIVISGTSLGCVSVLFGSTPAYSVTASSSTVTATSPPGFQGATLVTIRNPNNGAFANVAAYAYFAYANPSGPPSGVTVGPGDASLAISFSAPTNDGGSSVTDYEYSLDNGTSWTSAGSITSPIVVGGLTNGTTYTVSLRAITLVGPGSASKGLKATPYTVPGAPDGVRIEPGDGSLAVHFAPPASDGGSAVTGYEYSLDGGSTWSEAGTTISPIAIGGLANGTAYRVMLRAENAAGPGPAAGPVEATPFTFPSSPDALSAIPGDGNLEIAFQSPESDGGSSIADYEYSMDGGQSWHSTGASSSPVIIDDLTNGDSYSIALRAVNAAGPGPSSDAISSTPYTFPDVPRDLSLIPYDGGLVISFSDPSNNGGSPILDFEYSLNGGIVWISAGATSSPIQIDNLRNGETYIVSLRAVNAAGPGPASGTVTGTTPSPSSYFDAVKSSVEAEISQQAIESLKRVIAKNLNIVAEARDRLAAGNTAANADQQDLDFAGELTASDVGVGIDATVSRTVKYHDLQVIYSGNLTLLDSKTGNSHFDLGVQSEVNPTNELLLGAFGRAGLDAEGIEGEFVGSHRQLDLVAGGYAVGQLRDDLVLDAFMSVGVGRNDLHLMDSTLALRSSYVTRSVTLGASLTGHVEGSGYELWPQLTYSFGRTYIGTVDLEGTAYGLVDPQLSVDAGTADLMTVLFRPEIRVPFSGLQGASGTAVAIVAPLLSCEGTVARPTLRMCGLGGQLGVQALSRGGSSMFSANISSDPSIDGGKPSLTLSITSNF